MSNEDHQAIEQAAKEKRKSLNDFICESAMAAARGSSPNGPRSDAPRADVALLVDLDSFAGKQSINVDALLNAVASFGRIVQRKSFATPVASDLNQHRARVVARHFEHEELPSRDALRIRMTTDAIEALHATMVKQFVIATADESLAYTVALLRSYGAFVVGIGLRAAGDAGPDFIREFDDFRYYDQVDMPPPSKDLFELRHKYAEGLAQVTLRLEARHAKAVGAAVVPILRDQYPEVSLAQLELRNWRELAEFAREQHLVEIAPYGLDFHLTLTNDGRQLAQRLEANRHVGGTEVAAIRNAIHDSIGADLPDGKTRFMIFATTQWAMEEAAAEGGIPLVKLSETVAGRLTHATVSQNVAYRLINGLNFVGALENRPNPLNDKDPIIFRSKVPLNSLDDAFLLNLTRLLRKRHAGTLSADSLATVYFQSTDEAKINRASALLQIASDPAVMDKMKLPKLLSRLTVTE
jgi:hypothetical protein